MNTTTKYIIVLIALTLFSACFKDDSDFGNRKISEISLTESLNEEYHVDKWETFTLAPQIEQTIKDQDLAYEWQLDYKVISTEKELSFEASELGEFPVRLKVTNDDGSQFFNFTLKVNSPYQEGLLVMSKFEGASMLSFKRIDKESKFLKNVYSINNPKYPLGVNPTLIYQQRDMLYIGSSEPTVIMRIDRVSFEAKNILDFPGNKLEAAFSLPSSLGITFLGDGKVYDYDARQNFFFNVTMNSFKKPNTILSEKAVIVPTGSTFFNKPYGDLVYLKNNTSTILDTYPNHELIAILPIDEQVNILAILQDSDSGKTSVARYNMANLSRSNFYDATGTTIDENGVFLTHKSGTNIYYSSGNKIYAYNYLADNFPTNSFIALNDSAANIKAMLFDETGEKLYVAANSGSDGITGNVYCYNMATKELLWSEEGVAGDIVQMIYKN